MGRRIPVIFLTAKNDIVDKSTGFKAGADDYVTKPFIADELLLRIDAHVRRHRGDIEYARKVVSADAGEPARREPCRIRDLEVLFDRYEVRLRGEAVPLTARSSKKFLRFWLKVPVRCSRVGASMSTCGGEVAEVDENLITVFMRKIREKIEDNPSEPPVTCSPSGASATKLTAE